MPRKPKIAIVLSGCGVYDGSEIHEAVLTMLAVAREGADYQCFAPNIEQRDVVDHSTGQAVAEKRNVLVELARLARGEVKDLAEFETSDFDAVIFPGGYGAAKNLCSFAVDGDHCSVEASVGKVVRCMHAAGKPIGALCIAPAILARVLGTVDLTIGSDKETAATLTKMGAHHFPTTHGEVIVDDAARIATTPCYMLDATIDQIADGAHNLVKAVLRLVR